MMKKLYATVFFALGLLAAKAQTFSPAVKSTGTNTFSYNFSQVKGNESKQIDFIISGVANGTQFKAVIDQELDFVDNEYCGMSYGELNYEITAGETGVIAQSKGTITVLFNPKDFLYGRPVFFRDWDGSETTNLDYCELANHANYGVKTATMTVTLYTPTVTNYEVNLSGNSVAEVVTALQSDTKAKTINASLFYPNPVKDVLILNQEATVFDAFGKVILSGKGSMDVSKIHSGVYYVQSAGQTQKFVKE